jgi:hypothetical protein
MKNLKRLTFLCVILLVSIMIINGCKKKSDNPVNPEFTITYSIVTLQGGGDGLQFFAKCTNQAVDMDKVTITDPESVIVIYQYSGASYAENELFQMQGTDEAYLKMTGTWSFNLVGTRKTDGAAFAVDVTQSVTK